MSMEIDFDEIFKKNYKQFVGISYNYTRHKHISEEVVQDVFFDFWKRLQRNEQILNHQAYLRRAVVLRSLSTLKKERRYIDTETAELEVILESSQSSTSETSIFDKDKKKKLKLAISALPDRTREVFTLSRFENFSHIEIADCLEISTKTVEYHITKALLNLRKSLLSLLLLISQNFF